MSSDNALAWLGIAMIAAGSAMLSWALHDVLVRACS